MLTASHSNPQLTLTFAQCNAASSTDLKASYKLWHTPLQVELDCDNRLQVELDCDYRLQVELDCDYRLQVELDCDYLWL